MEKDGALFSQSPHVMCASVCVWLCVLCEVKPLTAVLLLGDSADNIAGVHEAQEL